MTEYKNKKILVVGLGRSGLAAAKYLSGLGADVTVNDRRSERELSAEVGSLLDSLRADSKGAAEIKFRLGGHPSDLFVSSDIIILSPGVPLDIEGIVLARKKGIPVVCELELGLPHLTGKVVAITGTNGKSTTTELIGLMLGKKGSTWVGGNLGTPLIAEIEKASDSRYVVLEVSSYQLELTPSLKPYISVWLNATPDHLDRYDSFNEYVNAKAQIGVNQDGNDWAIFNCEDTLVAERVKAFNAKKVPFSVVKILNSGAWYEGSNLKCSVEEAGLNITVDTDGAKITGAHNRENIAAAALVAGVCGASSSDIENVLREFGGLPHRLQFVRELNGVKYFDDSKGTNVGAVVKSIESFDAPVVLIAGGQDKNTGYADMKEIVKQKVRHIIAIGEAAGKIRDELANVAEITICGSMKDAVRTASAKSVSGDVVLLSPACASFDMYKNYAERGEDFIRCVNEL